MLVHGALDRKARVGSSRTAMDSTSDMGEHTLSTAGMEFTGMQTAGTAQCRRRIAISFIPLHVQINRNENEELEEQEQQLLPGIPDEVTLEWIAPKLPWKVFHILSAVSRCWRQKIQSRLVYDSRARVSSTETVVLHDHLTTGNTNRIALYSAKDDCCYELPPISGFPDGIPSCSQCISLKGKVYVLGGEFGSQEVYVLDVPGQRHWEQCASMQVRRRGFACGVKDGKIYVFGGVDCSPTKSRSEVYDPEVDAWSWMMPTVSKSRYYDQLAAPGQGFFVHGQKKFLTCGEEWHEDLDPIEDILTVLGPSAVSNLGCLFEAHGKTHWMNYLDIYVYDIHDSSWRYLHSNSFPIQAMGPTYPMRFRFRPRATFAVGAELFVRAAWYSSGSVSGLCLLRSKGFGGKIREIFWEVVSECHGSVALQYFPCDFPKLQCTSCIQL